MNTIDEIMEKHRHMYTHNAWFKSGADVALHVLSYTLDGLALDAERNQIKYDAAVRLAMNQLVI